MENKCIGCGIPIVGAKWNEMMCWDCWSAENNTPDEDYQVNSDE